MVPCASTVLEEVSEDPSLFVPSPFIVFVLVTVEAVLG